MTQRQSTPTIAGPAADALEPPDALPRATMDLPVPLTDELIASMDMAVRSRTTQELTQPRARARGTPPGEFVSSEQIRALVFAPEPTRATWIEGELGRAPVTITIQIGRRVRTVVAALLKDPPPRPEVLIVDFDALSAGELLELHALRNEGWFGRLIGLGAISLDLRTSLGVDHVLAPPFIRDSLLDCVAGTRHAAVTAAIPVIPLWDDRG